VITHDALRGIKSGERISNAVASSAEKLGISCPPAKTEHLTDRMHSVHGHTSNAFNRSGTEGVTFIGKNYSAVAVTPTKQDLENLFKLAVRTVGTLLEEGDSSAD
jgi:hypothetical protein